MPWISWPRGEHGENMKNKMSMAVRVLCGSLLLFILWGCGVKSQETPPPPVLMSIAISPPAPSIAPGTTLLLRAVGQNSNGSQTNLTALATWNSSNTAVATVDQGLVSAVSNTSGTTTISASYNGIAGTTVLTSSPLASIDVLPADQSLAPGTTIQYTATGTLSNAATQNVSSYVSWGSSDANIASITGGLATAGSTTGTATITAVFSAVTGSTSLTSAHVSSIAVSPSAPSIAKGTTQQFTATGTLTNTATQALTSYATWSSSNAGVATISNTAGTKGLATAVSEGTTTISSTFDGVLSTLATLAVTTASLSSIVVTPVNPSIALGNTQQFTATGTFSDGSHQDISASVTWSSSKTTVATISNATGSNGLATSAGVGTATITAATGGISGTTTLTVTPAVLKSILVTPVSAIVQIAVTNVQQFTATGIFSDGSFQDLTKSVTWSAKNTIHISISNTAPFQGLATNFDFTPDSANISATFSGITSNAVILTFF